MKKILGLAAALATAGVVGSASAADMPVKMPVKAAPVVAPYNWTGLYVGLQGGYAWGSSVQFFTAGAGGSTDRFNINGWQGGGTLGYNWQIQQWVVGLETDFSGSHISGSTNSTASYGCGTACTTNVTSFGTLRGRLGYTWNNVLLYGTGGLAYANINSALTSPTGTGNATNWRAGWAAGAGMEYGFAPHWSAKIEWVYVAFNSFQWINTANGSFNCVGLNCSTDAKFNVVRAGVNYHF